MKTTITVNGQTYASVDQMPPEVRREYEMAMGLLADKDGNGIPDILEGKGTAIKTEIGGLAKSNVVTKLTTSSFIVNGQEYSQWEDLPPAFREAIEKAGVSVQANAALATSVPIPKTANAPLSPFPAEGGLKIGLPWVILLVLVAMLVGILIAWKALR